LNWKYGASKLTRMSTAEKLKPISVDDYLAGELTATVKHEYVAGVVYARAGARNLHNLIASNTLGVLGSRLRGKRCRAFNSDTKIRILFPTHTRFYYPDVSVICQPGPPTDSYQEAPAVVVEVLSARTRRIDEGEKKDAYLTIPSLNVYLLVEQESAAVVVWRRTEQGFVHQLYRGLDAVLPLGEIDIQLPLAEIYEAVEFVPEPEET
jgi:Uma2 family endonuclease